MYEGKRNYLCGSLWSRACSLFFLPGWANLLHCGSPFGLSGHIGYPALRIMEGFSVKIVVVHSPKVLGFFLRKFFHIQKEQPEPRHE
jgi:hypothetical protein